jgi:hypothetical protein
LRCFSSSLHRTTQGPPHTASSRHREPFYKVGWSMKLPAHLCLMLWFEMLRVNYHAPCIPSWHNVKVLGQLSLENLRRYTNSDNACWGFIAVGTPILVFCVVTLCNHVGGYHCFGKRFCLHQGIGMRMWLLDNSCKSETLMLTKLMGREGIFKMSWHVALFCSLLLITQLT